MEKFSNRVKRIAIEARKRTITIVGIAVAKISAGIKTLTTKLKNMKK